MLRDLTPPRYIGWVLSSPVGHCPSFFYSPSVRLEADVGVLDAYSTATNTVAKLASLERFADRPFELEVLLDCGQPEAELIGEVVARSTRTVALNERCGPEILEAGSGTGQRLTTSLGAGGRVHGKTVADPQLVPSSRWTLGYRHGLAVDCYDVGRGFTHHASTDVLPNGVFSDGHHWYRGVRRKPVGLVVTAGIIAHAVEVAKQERHGAKSPQAGAGVTEILVVGLLIAFDV